MTMIVMVRMRAKLCFFACILFTVGFLVISDHKQQSIKTIVQETQNQLDNLKKNFKDVGKLLVVDSKYMEKLMKTSIDDDLANATFSSVVILTAVVNGRAGEAVHFVRNAHLFMPNLTVIIYDLGLSGHESSLVNTYCNESCHLIKFDPDGFYPVHVRKFSRPVIIQETLKVATHSVIYMDIDQRFVTKDISTFLYNCSRMGGISAWLRDDYNIPTSALTHPKMFEYLVDDKDQVDNFNFQHMITARVLVINKSTEIMEKVVRHWAECALLQDCVEPIGSQSTGCRLLLSLLIFGKACFSRRKLIM